MATNKVDINLSVQDQSNSIKQRTNEVKNLNKELQKAQSYTTGTKSGGQAAQASYSAAAQNMEYGRARGSMGATGASGRDFANQAQGLGGLVRLYATYAANVFAVSAAFRALSDAMDTSNMVKGLDQLGAASGVAMGSLAKRFTEASGGAISLRESMEATAKAMSSGMTQKQFLQLGEVAKKASQALGVNMSDAVSRLTRGITKLEPELLDELGLFTKVGKASEDYARSVGKSVDSLTDFEKRQAFANAVLKEGIDKFSEIDIPTNPYDKLLASLKNIAQTILEVLNKAFAPLVSILSASPVALTAGIAALGAMIVKQAVPAISNYRDELRKTADISQELTKKKVEQSEQIMAQQRAALKAKSDAAAQEATDKIDKLETKLRELSGGRLRKDIAKILDPQTSIQSISEKDILKIEKAGSALKGQTNVYKELALAIRAAKTEEQKYLQTEKELEARAAAGPSRFSAAGRLRASAEAQARSSTSSRIISNAADTASLAGFRAAFGEMVDSLKTEKLGVVRTLFTGVAATATAAGTRLMSFASILGNVGMVIGIAVGIFQALNEAFTNNSKQLEVFNTSIENSRENIKGLTETYAKYSASLNVSSIIALTTSFTNLSDGISSTVKALENADKAANSWDRFVDAIKGIFGQDIKSQFAKSMSVQITDGLKGIVDPKLRTETAEKLKNILDVTELTGEIAEKSISSMAPAKVIKVGKDIADAFETAAKAGAKTGATLSAVKDGFKSLETSYTELSNSLVQKDVLSNFGKDLASQGFKLQEAFKDPIATLATLQDVLTDISKLKLLSPESQALLMQNKEQYVDLINKAKDYENQIKSSESNIAKFREQMSSRLNKAPIQAKITAEQGKISSAESALSGIRKEMADISKEFGGVAEASIAKGFALIEGGFNRAMAQTLLSSQKSLLDKLPQTAETAKLGARLENQKIDIQIKQITETQNLIKEMELSRLQAERIHIEEQRDAAIRESKNDTSVRARVESGAAPRLKEIEDRTKLLSSKNISADIQAGKLARTPESLKAMQEQQGTLAQVGQLNEQKKMNLINAQIVAVQSGFDKARKTLDSSLKDIVGLREEETKSTAFQELSLEKQKEIVDKYIEQEDIIKRALNSLEAGKEVGVATTIQIEAQNRGWDNIAKVASDALATAQEQFNVTDKQFTKATNTANVDRKRKDTLEIMSVTMAGITQALESQANLKRILNETESNLLSIQKETLQTQLDLGIISEDSYRSQIIELEKIDRIKQRDIKLEQLQNTLILARLNLAKEYAEATTGEGKAAALKKAEDISIAYLAEVDGVNRVYEAQKKSKSLIEDLTDRQRAYGDIFKQSFEGMADAVIEFTKTGKLNFKGMIDSMIEGLIRYEMRQQAMMMYSAFRPGLMNLIGSIFGGPAAPILNPTGPAGAAVMGFAGAAKGAAYDVGLQKFAQGGAFTNSIVSSPTLFKFAKGTGLMGEAGPEAIMPLKRDSNGNLGVRSSQQGNVDVVVNNFGSEKATTKETTDSRGNRKIEVIIGDMVAGEIGRSGSSIQQSLSGNFGNRPAVARR